MLAHLRAQHRSNVSGFRTVLCVQLPLHQGRRMLHPVCLRLRRDNRRLRLHLSVLKMAYASSVISPVTSPESAPCVRINWSFTLLAAEMAVATTGPPTIILGLLLMLADMLTTLMLKQLRNSPLL